MKSKDNMKTWGIIGLGWLGLTFSQSLKTFGYSFWGTQRDSFSFETGEFPQTFCDLLLVNTPPLTHIPPSDFSQKIFLGQNSRLIFISSTGVYANNSGRVTESTEPMPNTAAGLWLVETERQLRERFKERLTIVRPGGLIGGKRHPVYSLAGRRGVTGGNDPINLIHRDDLISILFALETRPDIQLLNAVAPYHPPKKDYYGKWAANLKLDNIQFSDEVSSNRIVESEVVNDLYSIWKCPKLDYL